MRDNNRRTDAAFTMIELLVVIAIIAILAGAGMAMFGMFSQGKEVKASGRIVQAMFAKTRGTAAKTRRVHFLQFDPATQEMRVYRDENRNKVFEPGTDPEVKDGRQMALMKGCLFGSGTPPYVGFRPDGTLILPKSAGTTLEVYKNSMPDIKVTLDFSATSGLITRSTFTTQ